jgi:signal transduction histidine kinase
MEEEKDIFSFDLSHDVYIYTILRDAKSLFQSEAVSRGIVIEEPKPMEIPFPHLKGSTPHLKKVFVNLLSNAVKYSFDGYSERKKPIKIICRPVYSSTGCFYCVEISNYGVGILPDEKEKVFEYGYRGRLARDRNRFGSGIGLPTVKKIVEKHGGKVDIDSYIDGPIYEGSKLHPYKTSVKVYLPLEKR